MKKADDDPRAKRRKSVSALVFGAGVGILILIVNIRALMEHRLVYTGSRHGYHLTSPWTEGLIGVFMLVMCLWALWKTLREK